MNKIYFDNSATTYPKPEGVIQGITEYLTGNGSNPGRSGHSGSIDAGMVAFQTRKQIADLYGLKNPMRIIFTYSATDSLNLAIKGLLKDGDHVVTTSMEHNSVLRPLNFLKESIGIELSIVNGDTSGAISPGKIEEAITDNTALVVVNHISNVNGVVQPIKEIGEICKSKEIPFLVDCSQSAGLIDFDINEFGVSLIAVTGHKALYGPTGTGALIISDDFDYKKVTPIRHGGTGSKSDLEIQPDFLPDCFESGTLNICGIYGLNRGLTYIKEFGLKKVREHKGELTDYFVLKAKDIPGIKLYIGSDFTGVISFRIENRSITEIFRSLEEKNIMVRQGLHCAPLAHRTLGTYPEGTIRISFGLFNTKEEVDKITKILKEI